MTQPSKAITRADLINLGRAGKPWDYLPIAIEALKAVPDDGGLRFLTAANFAAVGLRTAAGEQLDVLKAAGPQAEAHPDVVKLATAIESLPDDRVPIADAHQTAMRNIRALRANRPHLSSPIAAGLAEWSALNASGSVERFRAADGNVVLRRGGGWQLLADLKSVARAFVDQHLPKANSAGSLVKPILIEGASPPWLLISAMQATPRTAIGYQPRVILVQEHPLDLIEGLAAADLSTELTAPRLHIEIGPDAASKLESWLLGRKLTQVAGLVVTTPGTTRAASPSVSEAVQAVVRVQEDEHRSLQASVERRYAPRTPAWWAHRMSESLAGRSEPLKVLIPTSVYSTFVQHSAADLAHALNSNGYRAVVLKESNRNEMLATTATLEAIDRLEPDLVLMLNHTRRVPLGSLLPDGLPVVTWVQDSAPEVFAPGAVRADGPLDFVVGHLLHRVTEQLGVKPGQSLALPVAVNAAKFHDGPLDHSLRNETACDVSIATHQSQTPQQFAQRWLDEQQDRALRTMGERVSANLMKWLETGDGRVIGPAKRIVRETVEDATGHRDAAMIDQLRYGLAMPLADRVLRHRVAHWCAHLARHQGVRFALWGNGWDEHPTFARYARGSAAHGEQLRAIYQASGAHLHISAHTLVHQRVAECALSGGLPLCYLSDAAATPLRSRMQAELMSAMPVRTDADGTQHFSADATPLARQYAALCGAANVPADIFLDASLRAQIETGSARPVPEHLDPAWLMGDMAAVGFTTLDQLAGRIERASDPQWRSAYAAPIMARAAERFTHSAMIEPMFQMMARSLASRRQAAEVAA